MLSVVHHVGETQQGSDEADQGAEGLSGHAQVEFPAIIVAVNATVTRANIAAATGFLDFAMQQQRRDDERQAK